MVVDSHEGRAGGKLPRGPHKLSDAEVAVDQRKRLIDAIIELAAERGYAATTVADIIKRAQVSRKAFYEHFEDRRDLLLAAFDSVSPASFEAIRDAAQRGGRPSRQFEALMRRLCRVARESPGTIALETIEIAAVDPDGLERRERLMGAYGELLDDCLRAESEQPALPQLLARTLAGGAYRTIDARLRAGRADQLAALSTQLARWTRAQHPVPPSLIEAVGGASPLGTIGASGLYGGRAPGTLTLSPDGYRGPNMSRSKGFKSHANRERILDAVAQLSASHGYTELTARAIAERADLSERGFLAHFKNKDEAFAAAVELGHLKGQAIVERARFETPDWRTGVRNAIYALIEYLASEPYFTRLAFVEAPLARPLMVRRAHEHAEAYARLLLEGAPQRKRPPQITPEATMHAIFELAFHHAAERKVEALARTAPEATYMALAPYVGVSEAAKLATAAG
ncbi:MAG TPA: TetR/AcrR family transcriptional regulator [Solirubrobacteraceae bacterium]